MRRLTSKEVNERSVKALGLDPSAVDLTSIEAISGSLRRAASFLCPCPSTTLVQAVLDSLKGIVDDNTHIREKIKHSLQTLVAYGDLLELDAISGEENETGSLIHVAPPAFVRRKSGAALLLGTFPDNISQLPEELQTEVEYVRHVRRISASNIDYLVSDLLQVGFIELDQSTWLKEPPSESAADHLGRLQRMLDVAPPSGDVSGLIILDPETPVRYYPGRWVSPKSHNGRVVARREQLYGAKLWCYIDLLEGSPRNLLDLPLPKSMWRGCDEAWRLQAAIDSQRGEPQRFRVREGFKGNTILDFFAPVPIWAQRRWDVIGDPAENRGCLFSYCFSDDEVGEEINFAQEQLWLTRLVEN